MVASSHSPGETIPPPDYAKTSWKFWPSGSHKWVLGADVPAAVAGQCV